MLREAGGFLATRRACAEIIRARAVCGSACGGTTRLKRNVRLKRRREFNKRGGKHMALAGMGEGGAACEWPPLPVHKSTWMVS